MTETDRVVDVAHPQVGDVFLMVTGGRPPMMRVAVEAVTDRVVAYRYRYSVGADELMDACPRDVFVQRCTLTAPTDADVQLWVLVWAQPRWVADRHGQVFGWEHQVSRDRQLLEDIATDDTRVQGPAWLFPLRLDLDAGRFVSQTGPMPEARP